MRRSPLTRRKPLHQRQPLRARPASGKKRRQGWGIRWDALDARFSKWIRLRDKACQYCGRSDRRLEAAHIFGRGQHSVRYDPENVFAMCGGPNVNVCHRYLDTHDTEKKAWLRARLGPERFDALARRAATSLTGLARRAYLAEMNAWLLQEELRLRDERLRLREKGVLRASSGGCAA